MGEIGSPGGKLTAIPKLVLLYAHSDCSRTIPSASIVRREDRVICRMSELD